MVIARLVLQPPLCGIGSRQILEMRRRLKILNPASKYALINIHYYYYFLSPTQPTAFKEVVTATLQYLGLFDIFRDCYWGGFRIAFVIITHLYAILFEAELIP